MNIFIWNESVIVVLFLWMISCWLQSRKHTCSVVLVIWWIFFFSLCFCVSVYIWTYVSEPQPGKQNRTTGKSSLVIKSLNVFIWTESLIVVLYYEWFHVACNQWSMKVLCCSLFDESFFLIVFFCICLHANIFCRTAAWKAKPHNRQVVIGN